MRWSGRGLTLVELAMATLVLNDHPSTPSTVLSAWQEIEHASRGVGGTPGRAGGFHPPGGLLDSAAPGTPDGPGRGRPDTAQTPARGKATVL